MIVTIFIHLEERNLVCVNVILFFIGCNFFFVCARMCVCVYVWPLENMIYYYNASSVTKEAIFILRTFWDNGV